jgi:serine/threonine-protein kinase
MAKLICRSSANTGREYPLTKDITVLGRHSTSDVPVQDNMASRAHCHIRRDGQLYSVVDLESRNGTKLNGHKVTERLLSFGDRISIGEASYELVKEQGDLDLGDLLSKYEVHEKIGEGGMGAVYRATQRSMARTVALKILSPKYAQKPKFVEQFVREARAAGQLNHPNIVQVHEVGTENGIHFFSMEYVDGPTCAQIIKNCGSLDAYEALEIALQTAKALDYAHQHRLIHQDIKPDNLMLGDNNTIKVADLGISRTFDETATAPRLAVGTPHYMAPEMALGKIIDHRVDLYSLGVTLYYLLAGRVPFDGIDNITAIMQAQVADPPPPLSEVHPETPPEVIALIDDLMAKNPDDRPHTAGEVVERILALQSGGSFASQRQKGTPRAALARVSRSSRSPSTTRKAAPMTTPSANATISAADAKKRQLKMIAGISGGAVVLLLIIVVALRPSAKATTVDTSAEDAAAQAQADAKAAKEKQIYEWTVALTEITKSLNNPVDLDLDGIKTRILAIKDADTDHALTSLQSTLDKLESAIVIQRSARAEAAFTTLRSDVQGLLNNSDFSQALAKIDAFAPKDEPVVKSRWEELRAHAVRTSTSYLGNLRQNVDNAIKLKSIPRLTALRQQLPPALTTSDAAQTIDQAIATLQAENMAKQTDALKQITTALRTWNLDQVKSLAATNRALITDADLTQQLTTCTTTASSLNGFIAALNKSVATRKPRLTGMTIAGLPAPLMAGADTSGLRLQLVNLGGGTGGTMIVPWNKLTETELRSVADLVLGKEPAKAYDAAFTHIASIEGTKAAPAAPQTSVPAAVKATAEAAPAAPAAAPTVETVPVVEATPAQ